MFANATTYACRCNLYQRIGKPTTTSSIPVIPILAQIPFEKWIIDFVGHINPFSYTSRHNYILVATKHITKWAKAKTIKIHNAKIIAKFPYQNIITEFGCPKEIVSDRGTHFLYSTIENLTTKYSIKHKKSIPYHPRANGQTKKTTGISYKIITKTIEGSTTDWD